MSGSFKPLPVSVHTTVEFSLIFLLSCSFISPEIDIAEAAQKTPSFFASVF